MNLVLDWIAYVGMLEKQPDGRKVQFRQSRESIKFILHVYVW